MSGMKFVGQAYYIIIDCHSKVVSWPEIGVTLTIPEGTLPEGKICTIRAQCCMGPFELPEGIELCSHVYYVSVSSELQKDIEFTLPHFANVKKPSDFGSLMFLHSLNVPGCVQRHKGFKIIYRFRKMDGGKFTKETGTIKLKKFCNIATGMLSSFKRYYYAKLVCPKEPLVSNPHAVFSVSLPGPQYDNELKKFLKETFPEEKFSENWQLKKVVCVDDEMRLVLPNETELAGLKYKIKPDMIQISKDELDLPLMNKEYQSFSSPLYPPRREISIGTIGKPGSMSRLNCECSIEGVTPPSSFKLTLPEVPPTSIQAMSASLRPTGSKPLNIFDQAPTLKDLRLLQWRDEENEGSVRVIETGCNKWKSFGDLVEIPVTELNDLHSRYRTDQDRFHSVLSDWLKTNLPQAPTWRILVELLRNCELSTLADKLEKALPNRIMW